VTQHPFHTKVLRKIKQPIANRTIMNTNWKDLMTSFLERQILEDWLHLETFFEEVMTKPIRINGIFSTANAIMLMVDVLMDMLLPESHLKEMF
jgi:hypothetical protein